MRRAAGCSGTVLAAALRRLPPGQPLDLARVDGPAEEREQGFTDGPPERQARHLGHREADALLETNPAPRRVMIGLAVDQHAVQVEDDGAARGGARHRTSGADDAGSTVTHLPVIPTER